ncbi:MAG: GNAT family N-acetyltransferase, partial [Hominenteromicrobium sp.]
MASCSIRFATEEDIPVVLRFIHALAAYEKMEDQVIVTDDLLREWVFEKRKAEILLVLEEETPVGF